MPMGKNGSVEADIGRNATWLGFRIFRNQNVNDHDFSPVELAKVICKYANRKTIADLLFDGRYNVCSINHLLRDICSRNMHNIDLDLYNGPRSNDQKPIYDFLCVDNCHVWAICHHLRDKYVNLPKWSRFES